MKIWFSMQQNTFFSHTIWFFVQQMNVFLPTAFMFSASFGRCDSNVWGHGPPAISCSPFTVANAAECWKQE